MTIRITAVVRFIALPQLLAAVHVQQHDDKESDRDAHHQQIPHKALLYQAPCLPPYHQTKPTAAVF